MAELTQTDHLNKRLLVSFSDHIDNFGLPKNSNQFGPGGGNVSQQFGPARGGNVESYNSWADEQEEDDFSAEQVRSLLCFGLLQANKLKVSEAFGIPAEIRKAIIVEIKNGIVAYEQHPSLLDIFEAGLDGRIHLDEMWAATMASLGHIKFAALFSPSLAPAASKKPEVATPPVPAPVPAPTATATAWNQKFTEPVAQAASSSAASPSNGLGDPSRLSAPGIGANGKTIPEKYITYDDDRCTL
jgi:hypothetical protein